MKNRSKPLKVYFAKGKSYLKSNVEALKQFCSCYKQVGQTWELVRWKMSLEECLDYCKSCNATDNQLAEVKNEVQLILDGIEAQSRVFIFNAVDRKDHNKLQKERNSND